MPPPLIPRDLAQQQPNEALMNELIHLLCDLEQTPSVQF